jgi:pycsar effector protein
MAEWSTPPGNQRFDGGRYFEVMTVVNDQARADAATPQDPQVKGLDYARRVYEMVIDWYKTAEKKAQLLLTANGAFATILFGIVSSNPSGLQQFGVNSGAETWFFVTVAVTAFCGAVGFASAGLLSRHRHNIQLDFTRLDVRPEEPKTYKREAVWYFGHIASLQFGPTVDLLRTADPRMEFDSLTYNVVGLSRVVLRKHRLVNIGWMLTAVTVLAMTAAAASLIIRTQM